MANMKGLYSVLNHVPEKLHRVGSRLGDNVSRKKSLMVLDEVSNNFDQKIRDIKKDIEMLHRNNFSAQEMEKEALRLGIKGFSLFGDNVGKVTKTKKMFKLCPFSTIKTFLSDDHISVQHWS